MPVVSTGTGPSSTTGTGSRSGSIDHAVATIGQNSDNTKISKNTTDSANSNSSNSGSNGSGSGNSNGSIVVEKDELFLFEGLRLDGDAPEFEPKTQMVNRGW